MTRTISLITATVGSALLLAVPALGADPSAMLDSRERSFQTKQAAAPTPDWFERRAAAAVRDHREPVVDDRFRIDPTSEQATVTTSTGSALEVPQVGIGLGIALLLGIGLYLAFRYTRGRQPAH
jgi:hypothetical protein